MALHPQFFKVIINRNLEEKKVMIPKSFVDEYGEFLSSSVRLNLPDGMEWKVGLTTSTTNGTVWLEKDWEKISNHYGLEFGSFLVFRFDGNSNFHMIIMNKNRSEIKYEKEEDELLAPTSHTVQIINPNKASNDSKEYVGGRGPFFKRTMKKWSTRIIYIPGGMVRNMKISLTPNIVLRDENGELWKASICGTSQNRISISSGWCKFYRGHNLRENDECEFEFVLDGRNVCRQINVKITRWRCS